MNLELAWLRLRKLTAIALYENYRRAFLRFGVAPAIEHVAVLRQLPFDFVADVGANRGQFSLVCRQLAPQAAIMAFEPLKEAADIYRALFSADGRVSLHVCALAPERGEMAMHLSARFRHCRYRRPLPGRFWRQARPTWRPRTPSNPPPAFQRRRWR